MFHINWVVVIVAITARGSSLTNGCEKMQFNLLVVIEGRFDALLQSQSELAVPVDYDFLHKFLLIFIIVVAPI